jgi:hypothetical protein
MGQRGRPKGSLDKKPRRAGRWADNTRVRLGLPSDPVAGALRGARDIRGAWSSTAASRPGSSADDGAGGDDEQPEGATRADGSAAGAAEAAPDAEHARSGSSDEAGAPAGVTGEPQSEEDDDAEAEPQQQRRAAAAPVGETDIDDEEGLRNADERDTVTMGFFRLVQQQLQYELSFRSPGLDAQWLLAHLKQHDFWIRAHHARSIITKVLARVGGEAAAYDVDYIRDLRVWLPHVQYGFMPPHPDCKSAEHVGVQQRTLLPLLKPSALYRCIQQSLARPLLAFQCQKKSEPN